MKKKELFIFVFVSVIILCLVIFSTSFETLFSDTHRIREFILSFGILSPLVFILLHALQVIIAPIPGQLVGLLGGYLFGVWLGTLYSIIGTVLGTFIVVSLARKFGEPLARKLVDEKTYKKFDDFSREKGIFSLFLIYLLPFFPDDAISIIAGLSKLKIKHILLVAFIGRLPGMFGLSLAGAGIVNSEFLISLILIGIMLILSVIMYIYRNKLESKMEKVLDKIKLKFFIKFRV